MALELGATYNATWSRGATHLICPAPNPSKFAHALKDGKPIVQPNWIRDCHKQRTFLPVEGYELVASRRDKSAGSKRAAQRSLPRTATKKVKVDYTYGGWLDSDSEGTLGNGSQEGSSSHPTTREDDKEAMSGWGIEVSPALKSATATQCIPTDDEDYHEPAVGLEAEEEELDVELDEQVFQAGGQEEEEETQGLQSGTKRQPAVLLLGPHDKSTNSPPLITSRSVLTLHKVWSHKRFYQISCLVAAFTSTGSRELLSHDSSKLWRPTAGTRALTPHLAVWLTPAWQAPRLLPVHKHHTCRYGRRLGTTVHSCPGQAA